MNESKTERRRPLTRRRLAISSTSLSTIWVSSPTMMPMDDRNGSTDGAVTFLW